MSNLTINGQQVQWEAGETILAVAKRNGIYIPTLCYHPRLSPTGACRVCLVEVKGMPTLVASCTMPVSEGMVIKTDTERVKEARRLVVELLLSRHKMDCLTCESNGRCELQDLAYALGIERDKIGFEITEPSETIDESSPVIIRDPNKCILCGRCVRACQEVRLRGVIGFANRGYDLMVSAGADLPLSESECASCGECVQVCPVGALTEKLSRFKGWSWELKKVTTICPYCGVGCTVDLYVKENKVVRVMGNEEGVENKGSLCVKGKFGYDFINSPERLTSPLIRKNGKFQEASWDEALELVAAKFKELKAKYGSDSLAGFSSAKCTNEENYLFQKFIRTSLSTNNVDHCARLCHASTVVGLAQAFGSGAMTNSIQEIMTTDCLLVTGSNTTFNHPVIGMYIKQAVEYNGAKLIVADPRKIELVDWATLWLRQKSGTDVAYLNGMMNVIIQEELYDESFIEKRCENFEEFKKVIKNYTPEKVEEITGIPADDLREAARIYARAETASIIFSMGITQHTTGVNNVLSCANLAMLTGNVGRESTGVNPLRGQCNVQGACDMGGLPNVYPGYQRLGDDQVREKFEKRWGVKLDKKVGLTVVEIINAAYEGSIKGLYIMGENPMLSDPNLNHVKEGLERLEFLVVQDIFLTETAKLADVVLPGVSFAEKDGTFTNTARRIQRIIQAIEPIGGSWPDWQIICDLSRRMGYQMSYNSPQQIMEEIAELTPIYGGIHYDRLEGAGLQWPCPDREHPGTKYLHRDKFTRGKGHFTPVEFIPSAELPDDEYPFLLSTGRILEHFHTGTMSRRSRGLEALVPECLVEINPKDAHKLGINEDDRLKVASRRGELVAKAKLTERSREEMLFIPFHFKEAPANILTNDALDPAAKIPEYKVCAVKIEKLTEDKKD